MLPEDTIIFYNGKYKKISECKIGILTHSLHYGSCAFEGIRCYQTKQGPAIFRLKEHIKRLFYSAESLFMKPDYSIEEIMNACTQVIKKNNLNSAYIRPIFFYGDESMGLNPTNNKIHIAIIAWDWGKYLHDEVNVMISKTKRISEQTTVVDAKIGGHYINSIFATLEAKNKGYDEALLLDHAGFIAEGPGENIFFIKDNIITTPKVGKILQGITRLSIIEILKDLGYNIEEKEILPEEIQNYDSAFFTGTAAEVTPIKSIDKIDFDTSQVDKIKEKFFQIVEGKDEKYLNWLTLCN